MRFIKSTLIFSFLVIFSAASVSGQGKKSSWKPVTNHIMTKWAKDVKPANVLSEYPRPQLVRNKWMNLNGLWDYAIKAKDDNKPAKYDGKILVPFAVESALSGVNKKVSETDNLWYRRSFSVPADWKGKNIILHFGASDWETKVWINDNYVDVHKGGYDNFSYDITKYLKNKGKQELVVSVWDPADKGTQPHGKQVQEPGGIMYTSVTGIWQTVWLEPVSPKYINSIKLTPNIGNNTITVASSNVNTDSSCTIEAIVSEGDKMLVSTTNKAGRSIIMPIFGAVLWTPDNPYLYNLTLKLKDENGKVVDSVKSYFAMREIWIERDSNNIPRITLNHQVLFQFGPLDQGWWPDGLYTAPTDEALRFDIEMTKKMGFNMARKHVKVEPDRWYYWCDKLGLLVWQDMPSGDRGIGPNDPDITRSKESADQYMLELKEMITEKYNHPCIVMWVPFNEGWGQWNTAAVAKYVKELDPTRLVNNTSGWADRNVGDVHDVHIYPGPGMPELEKKRAVVLGEFGGLGLPLEGHTWTGKNNWGYVSFHDQSSLTSAYEDLVKKLFDLRDKGLSAAVYTQTTDVEVEVNGLMTYDRSIVKIDPGIISRIHKGYLSPAIESAGNIFVDSVKVTLRNKSPEGDVRYTLDGSEPAASSPVYTKPIIVKNNCTIKTKTFWPDGNTSGTLERKFQKVKPVKSIPVTNASAGIQYSFYNGKQKGWNFIPDLTKLQPDESGVLPFIDFSKWSTGEFFVLKYEGYIKVPETTVYNFILSSDDGSNLYIDDSVVVSNDGLHGTQEKPGSIALEAGYHKIRLEYLQGSGESMLKLLYSSDNSMPVEISSEMLFHTK
jgi:hypothetical protein